MTGRKSVDGKFRYHAKRPTFYQIVDKAPLQNPPWLEIVNSFNGVQRNVKFVKSTSPSHWLQGALRPHFKSAPSRHFDSNKITASSSLLSFRHSYPEVALLGCRYWCELAFTDWYAFPLKFERQLAKSLIMHENIPYQYSQPFQ